MVSAAKSLTAYGGLSPGWFLRRDGLLIANQLIHAGHHIFISFAVFLFYSVYSLICGLAMPHYEFAFAADDFTRIQRSIYRLAGIVLAAGKQDFVYGRLARRVRAKGLPSFQAYLDAIDAGDAVERDLFVNALTTNHTSFFREPHHFTLLDEQLRQARQRSPQAPLRIWCAGSSTGEEAWSLAITACDAFDSMMPPVSILASDIDSQALKVAADGVYPAERVALPAPRLTKFFVPGAASKTLAVRPELKALVRFTRINLLDGRWPVNTLLGDPVDAIFCRNVMIYFDRETQYAILKKFHPLLGREGRLYAGHSEIFTHAVDLFRPLGRTVYAPSGVVR
ncbi:MAG: protein-glutamate O-methyltransferase CheR [Rugosibacter sp.]|nr:protein-glutamate O-methyltransferase CheR [Rugosibacter sp.]